MSKKVQFLLYFCRLLYLLRLSGIAFDHNVLYNEGNNLNMKVVLTCIPQYASAAEVIEVTPNGTLINIKSGVIEENTEVNRTYDVTLQLTQEYNNIVLTSRISFGPTRRPMDKILLRLQYTDIYQGTVYKSQRSDGKQSQFPYKFVFKNSSFKDNPHPCLSSCEITKNFTQTMQSSEDFSTEETTKVYTTKTTTLSPIVTTTSPKPKSTKSTTLSTTKSTFISATGSIPTTYTKNLVLPSLEIMPPDPVIYYTPGVNYTYKCFRHDLKQNICLSLNKKAKEIITLDTSVFANELIHTFRLTEEENNTDVYCTESIYDEGLRKFRESDSKIIHFTLKTEHGTSLSPSASSADTTQEFKNFWDKYYPYIIGSSILFIICILVILVTFCLRQKKIPPSSDLDTTYSYVVGNQVNYARLELNQMQFPVPKKNQVISYAHVIGVLKRKENDAYF